MKISIKRDGRTLVIHDDTKPYGGLPYALLAHEGLGTPPLERIRLRGWRQDGETDLGAILRPRRFSLVLLIDPYRQRSNDPRSYRHSLFEVLNPDRESEIEFEFAPHIRRVIKAALVDAVAMPSAEIYKDRQRLTLILEASDPLFYDVEQRSVGWSGIAPGLLIPLSINLTVGDGALNVPQTFNNDGTYYSYCTITARGPFSSMTLRLNDVQISYGTLASDRVLIVNSAWGKASAGEYLATDNTFLANTLAKVTGDLTKLRVQPGANNVTLDLAGGTSQTQVTLIYTPAYLSL